MAVFEVEFYQLPNGREPAREFLMGLEMKMRAKLADTISSTWMDRRIILTNGFFKKTQKTPAGEIERAKRYRADFLKRCGGK